MRDKRKRLTEKNAAQFFNQVKNSCPSTQMKTGKSRVGFPGSQVVKAACPELIVFDMSKLIGDIGGNRALFAGVEGRDCPILFLDRCARD